MHSRDREGSPTSGILIGAPLGDKTGAGLRNGIAKQAFEHLHSSCHYLLCRLHLTILQPWHYSCHPEHVIITNVPHRKEGLRSFPLHLLSVSAVHASFEVNPLASGSTNEAPDNDNDKDQDATDQFTTPTT